MKKGSVIIPMHNSSKHIGECIDSVLNQTYSNIEVIVIDDYSSDNCVDIVESKINGKNENRVKIIKLDKNVGAARARNIGVDMATGELLCFLDSDDYWALDKLEKQAQFIEQNNNAFIYSDYAYLKNGKVQHIARVPSSINYAKALKNTTIFTSTVMFNMKYLNKEDIYMPIIKLGQDSLTWWKVLKKVNVAYGMNDILSVYRVGNKSLSSNKIKSVMGTWNILKMEKINIFKRIWYFICYIFNAIKRRL